MKIEGRDKTIIKYGSKKYPSNEKYNIYEI